MDRHNDVRFRGKRIDDLTREEAIEALRQALDQLKMLEGLSSMNQSAGRDSQYDHYPETFRGIR